jgi:hypothetical protein
LFPYIWKAAQSVRPARYTHFVTHKYRSQIVVEIEQAIELRRDPFTFMVNEEIFAVQSHPRHAGLEIPGKLVRRRNHHTSREVYVSPFAESPTISTMITATPSEYLIPRFAVRLSRSGDTKSPFVLSSAQPPDVQTAATPLENGAAVVKRGEIVRPVAVM